MSSTRDRARPGGVDPSLTEILSSLRDQLRRLEQVVGTEEAASSSEPCPIEPAWRRASEGEPRLPGAVAVGAVIALQLLLPNHLVIHPEWLLPALEGALLVGLNAANPRRISRTSTTLRTASVALIALISLANAWSTAELLRGLVNGAEGENAAVLLSYGASIYITNIVVFSLWYWEWDRGGPVRRAKSPRPYPDLLFAGRRSFAHSGLGDCPRGQYPQVASWPGRRCHRSVQRSRGPAGETY
jgi:hypothetical protein